MILWKLFLPRPQLGPSHEMALLCISLLRLNPTWKPTVDCALHSSELSLGNHRLQKNICVSKFVPTLKPFVTLGRFPRSMKSLTLATPAWLISDAAWMLWLIFFYVFPPTKRLLLDKFCKNFWHNFYDIHPLNMPLLYQIIHKKFFWYLA